MKITFEMYIIDIYKQTFMEYYHLHMGIYQSTHVVKGQQTIYMHQGKSAEIP